MNIRNHIDFRGSASDLVDLTIACGKTWGLPVDPDRTNERLVRYYVSEGVIDRPDRVGRDATYGYRQLLQLLTARRMVQGGAPLSAIAAHNATATTRSLEQGLTGPPPTAAELLVSAYASGKRESTASAGSAAGGSAGRRPRDVRPAGSSGASRSLKPSSAQPSIVDVLDEVRQIRDEWAQERRLLRSLRGDLDALRVSVQRSVDLAEEALRVASGTHDALGAAGDHLDQRLSLALDRLNARHLEIIDALAAIHAGAGWKTGPGSGTEPPTAA